MFLKRIAEQSSWFILIKIILKSYLLYIEFLLLDMIFIIDKTVILMFTIV